MCVCIGRERAESKHTHGEDELDRVSLFCFFVFESSVGMFLHGALPLPAPLPPVSLPLLQSPSLSTAPLLSNRKRPGKDCCFPLPPNPLPPQFFFPLAPYSRQIECTQLLPAETGLNCTPVAMATPDDLRGWNVALQISALGPPGSTDFSAWEVTHRAQPHLFTSPPLEGSLMSPRLWMGMGCAYGVSFSESLFGTLQGSG